MKNWKLAWVIQILNFDDVIKANCVTSHSFFIYFFNLYKLISMRGTVQILPNPWSKHEFKIPRWKSDYKHNGKEN